MYVISCVQYVFFVAITKSSILWFSRGCTCSWLAYQAMLPREEKKKPKEGLKIWELYEIDSTLPRPLLEYGFWTMKNGIALKEPSKWIRRKNLQVSIWYFHFSNANNYIEAFLGSQIDYPSIGGCLLHKGDDSLPKQTRWVPNIWSLGWCLVCFTGIWLFTNVNVSIELSSKWYFLINSPGATELYIRGQQT